MDNEVSEDMYDEPSAPRRRFVVIAAAVVVLAVVSVIGISSSMRTVPTGTKGGLLNWGKVVGTVDEGLNWVIPVAQDIVLMDVTVRKAETPRSNRNARPTGRNDDDRRKL